MADYYTVEQLAQKLGLTQEQLEEIAAKASFSPRVKNGRNYYSGQQAYQLQAALRLARKRAISLDEALEKVTSWVRQMTEGAVAQH